MARGPSAFSSKHLREGDDRGIGFIPARQDTDEQSRALQKRQSQGNVPSLEVVGNAAGGGGQRSPSLDRIMRALHPITIPPPLDPDDNVQHKEHATYTCIKTFGTQRGAAVDPLLQLLPLRSLCPNAAPAAAASQSPTAGLSCHGSGFSPTSLPRCPVPSRTPVVLHGSVVVPAGGPPSSDPSPDSIGDGADVCVQGAPARLISRTYTSSPRRAAPGPVSATSITVDAASSMPATAAIPTTTATTTTTTTPPSSLAATAGVLPALSSPRGLNTSGSSDSHENGGRCSGNSSNSGSFHRHVTRHALELAAAVTPPVAAAPAARPTGARLGVMTGETFAVAPAGASFVRRASDDEGGARGFHTDRHHRQHPHPHPTTTSPRDQHTWQQQQHQPSRPPQWPHATTKPDSGFVVPPPSFFPRHGASFEMPYGPTAGLNPLPVIPAAGAGGSGVSNTSSGNFQPGPCTNPSPASKGPRAAAAVAGLRPLVLPARLPSLAYQAPSPAQPATAGARLAEAGLACRSQIVTAGAAVATSRAGSWAHGLGAAMDPFTPTAAAELGRAAAAR